MRDLSRFVLIATILGGCAAEVVENPFEDVDDVEDVTIVLEEEAADELFALAPWEEVDRLTEETGFLTSR